MNFFFSPCLLYFESDLLQFYTCTVLPFEIERCEYENAVVFIDQLFPDVWISQWIEVSCAAVRISDKYAQLKSPCSIVLKSDK